MYSLKEIYSRGIVEICNELNILHNLMGIITNKEVTQLQLDDNVFVECEINWRIKESPYIMIDLKEKEYHINEFWLAPWINFERDCKDTIIYVDKLVVVGNRILDYSEPKFIVINLITDNCYMILGCKYFGNNGTLSLNMDMEGYAFIGSRHAEIIKDNNLKVTVRLGEESFEHIKISFGILEAFYEANRSSKYLIEIAQKFNLEKIIHIRTYLDIPQKSVMVIGIDSEYNVKYNRILYNEHESMKLVYMFLAECIIKRFEQLGVPIEIEWGRDIYGSTTGKVME